MTTLALRGPFGWDAVSAVHISLRKDEDFDDAKVTDILLGYSCHPPTIPGLLNSLKMCGRYDCVLQATWFKNQHRECIADLKQAGISLSVMRYWEGWVDQPWPPVRKR